MYVLPMRVGDYEEGRLAQNVCSVMHVESHSLPFHTVSQRERSVSLTSMPLWPNKSVTIRGVHPINVTGIKSPIFFHIFLFAYSTLIPCQMMCMIVFFGFIMESRRKIIIRLSTNYL